jgi:polar amino acid transport system substrate-binding protein
MVFRRALVAVLAALLPVAAACGPANDSSSSSGGSSTGSSCSKSSLPLTNKGELTIATDSPAYPPWFENNDPTNGKGFESAVAYAVADKLGFSRDQVKWTVEPFNKSYAPGPKDFDFDINQISITSQRAKAVDFSDGYYDVNQALVALKNDPVAKDTTLAQLKKAKLGAQVGTTSYSYVVKYVKPTQQAFAYDTTNDAKSALQGGQIDGIVVDLPTAFYISAVQISGSSVVGQFPSQGQTEQFGMLFEKGSGLVDCVNKALAGLRQDGTLAQIQKQWLEKAVSAPQFK